MQDTGTKTPALYDADFYAWANEQAALLRAGRLDEADIENIAEEIESTGKGEKRELVSRLSVLLMHLLQWCYQPVQRSRSWRLTIEGQRIELTDHLAENPSLKAQMGAALASAFRLAKIDVARETNLETSDFPKTCPWTYAEITDDDFWPEG